MSDARISAIALKYRKGLLEAIGRDGPQESVEDRLRRLSRFDPTPKGIRLEALARWHAKGSLKLEDGYKAREDLRLLETWGRRLPAPSRDPLAMEDPWVLADLTSPFAGAEPEGGRAAKRRDSALYRSAEQSEILYEGIEGVLAIPKTVESARWWGRGTRWCTAAREDEDNRFESFDEDGPLVVAVRADGKKFQWHAASGERADAKDRQMKLRKLLRKVPFVLKSAKAASILAATASSPSKIPAALRAAIDWREYVLADPKLIDEVPEEELPEGGMEALLRALVSEAVGLDFVADSWRTKAVCLAAVESDGEDLAEVPARAMDAEIVEAAARSAPESIRHAPPRLRTREACRAAVEGDPECLRFVPEGVLEPEWAEAAVAAVPRLLADTPERLRTRKACLSAVSSDPSLLRFVPDAALDESVALAFLSAGGRLSGLPGRLRTRSVCLASPSAPGRGEIPDPLLSDPGFAFDLVGRHPGALALVSSAARRGHPEIGRRASALDPGVLPWLFEFGPAEVLAALAARPASVEVRHLAVLDGGDLEGAVRARPDLWSALPADRRGGRVEDAAFDARSDLCAGADPETARRRLADRLAAGMGFEAAASAAARTDVSWEDRHWDAFLSAHPLLLGSVPRRARTFDRCVRACSADPGASRFVPWWRRWSPSFRRALSRR